MPVLPQDDTPPKPENTGQEEGRLHALQLALDLHRSNNSFSGVNGPHYTMTIEGLIHSADQLYRYIMEGETPNA